MPHSLSGSGRRRLPLAALVCATLALATVGEAQVKRSFTTRYSTNEAGAIVIRGNTLATCTTTASTSPNPSPPPSCASSQMSGAVFTGGVNNNYKMQFVDIDGDPSTFNSSRSSLTVPSGATVLFAGLYWSARGNNAQRGQVQFRTPTSAGYSTVLASQIDVNGAAGAAQDYSAFADVTSLVQAGGTGSYTVANVQATMGSNIGNDYAGWALVVVLRDGSKPLRNLSVFDGYANISGTTVVNTTVSGFLTPALGTPATKIGVVAYEGDRGWAGNFQGDSMKVNGVPLTDSKSPANDFFNSTLTDSGAYITDGQVPAYTNQLGLDAKTVITTAVPAGATSATLTFKTGGETYLPAVLTFQTDLFNPVINGNVVKSVTDVNGGLLFPGDTLQYDITVLNSGQDGAVNTVLTDTIPNGTTYVPGSLQIVSGSNAGLKTDAALDDQANFDATGRKRVLFRLGTGANGTSGGSMAPSSSTAMRFLVRLDDTVSSGALIENQAVVTATSATLGQPISAKSRTPSGTEGTPPTPITVAGPNLTLTKTHSGDFSRGGTGSYTITVSNIGNAATKPLTVTMTDTVPAPLIPTAASGAGWSCSIAGQVVTCTRPGDIAASSSAPPITLGVSIPVAAPGSVTNTARIAGGGDNTPVDNSASDLTILIAVPDLTVVKTAVTPPFVIGSTGSFRLRVKNVGAGATSDSIKVTDPLPAGLTFVSGTGTLFTCTAAGAVVTCARPPGTPLAAGDSVDITLTVNVAAAAAPSATNVATVTTALDPAAGNNSGSVVVPVFSSVDLQVVKSAAGVFTVGTNGVYSIAVTNVGATASSGVITVVDSLSAGLTFVSAGGGGFACAFAAPLVTCTRPASPVLAPAATATITLTVGITAGALPAVNNLARGSTAGDANATNDTSRVTGTPIAGVPDLGVTKTASGTFAVGVNGTFTIAVQNSGSAATTGSTVVTDTLAASLTFVSAAGTAGFACSFAAPVVTCTTASGIAAGATATITLTVNPTASAIPGVTNRAWARTPGDPNTANDSASTGLVGVVSVPDLAVTKSFTGPLTVGSTATYDIKVKNVSPGPTTGVITVNDPLPTGLTFVSGVGGGFTCSVAGANVSCTRPASPVLAAGDSVSVTLTVAVGGSAASGVVNRAASSTAGDVDFANDTSVTGSRTVLRPDLAVAKSHAGTFAVGVTSTWTLAVSNVGGGPTTGTLTLVDSIPAEVNVIGTTGSGWSCVTTGVVATGLVLTCTNPGPLSAGSSSGLMVQVSPNAAAIGTATNIARVSTPNDANAANDRTTDDATVVGVPDLQAGKSHSGSFVTGTSGAFKLFVSNVGSAATTGTITVLDTLPAGLSFVSGTATGYTCGAVAQVVTCTKSTALAPAVADTIALVVNVAVAAIPSVTNRVRVATPGDMNATNNLGVDAPTLVIGSPDLSISKSADSAFVVGHGASYSIAVSNIAPGSAAGPITVTDTMPIGLTLNVGLSGGGVSGFTCSLAGTTGGRDIASCSRATAIAATTTVTMRLAVNVTAAALPSQINRIWVSQAADVNPSNDVFTTGPVPITSVPDLAITKAPAGATVVGDTTTFNITVTNVSSGPTTGIVTVRDSLPAGLTFEPLGGGGGGFSPCVAVGQIVTCGRSAAPALASGESQTLKIRALVAVGAYPTVTNKASVTTPGDFVTSNDTAVTSPLPVTSVPDFSLTKTGAGPISVGSNTTFTLTLSNVSGTSAGTGGNTGAITLVDTLPAGLTFVSGGDPGTTFACSVTGTFGARQIVTCTRAAPPAQPALTSGQEVTLSIVASVGASALGTLTNSAEVTSAGDVITANNRSTTSAISVVAPNLTPSKSASTAFVKGLPASYSVTVSNSGTGTTTGAITLTDNLAPGIGYTSASGTGWSCSATGTIVLGQTVTCANAGPIAAGASSALTLTVLVDASAAASVNNTVTVNTANDTNAGDNSFTLVGTPVTSAPDLTLVKTASAPFTVGVNGTYRLSVKNIGSSSTTGAITVTDPLPAGLDFVSGTGAGWSCSASGATVTCTSAGPIAAADSSVILLTVSVAAGAVPSVTNTASASTAGDANPANNSGTAVTPAGTAPDLAITKTGPGSVTAGFGAAFSIKVKNVGSAATSSAITVTDTLAAVVSYVFGAGGGFACGTSGQVVTCTRTAALAPGDSALLTLNVNVSPSAIGSLSNTAHVLVTGDPNATNNASSATPAPIGTAPDLSMRKTAVGTFTVGYAAQYRLSVTNVGTAATSGTVTITDNLPAGLTFVSGTGAGFACSAVGSAVTCTSAGPVAVGDSAVVLLTVNVGPAASPSVTNVAQVSTPGDPSAGNDSFVATTPVALSPDLVMTKVASAASYAVGDTALFTLRVQNVGTAATTDTVRVVDVLPAGLTFLATVPAGGFTCSVAGATVSCFRTAPLAVSALDSVRFSAIVGVAAAPSFVNRAAATTAGDLSRGNDTSATAAIPVSAAPNLRLTKRLVGTLLVGGAGRFDLVVRNIVPVATTGTTTVVDTLPAGIGFASASGSGWSCSAAAQVVTCTHAGAIAGTDSSTATLNVSVGAAALPSVVNTAHASTPGEIVTTDNAGTTGAVPVTATPDVSMTKVASAASYLVGDTARFTLRARNVGTGATTDTVRVVDVLPAGLTFLSASPAGGFTCSTAGATVTCVRAAPLAVSATDSVRLNVLVGAAAAPSFVNRAAATTPGDLARGNDTSATATIPVTAAPNLQLAKRVVGTLFVGAPGRFDLVARNIVPVATTGTTTIVDTLPAGIGFTSASGSGWSCSAAGQVVTCTQGAAIAGNDSSTVSLTVSVSGAALPSIVNTAHVSTPGEVVTLDNAGTTGTVATSPTPDLAMTKVASAASYAVGDTARFTLRVQNVGTAATTDTVRVVDVLPAGLTFLSASPAGGFTCSLAASTVSCVRAAAMAAAAIDSVRLNTLVGVAAAPGFVNRGVATTAGDVVHGNDTSATATIPVAAVANLQLAKRVVGSLPVGGTGRFDLVARNIVPVATTGATTIVDTLPAGIGFASASGAGWSCTATGQIVTCTQATPIAGNDSSKVSLIVNVSAAALPSIVNTAHVSTPGEAVTSDNAGTTGTVPTSPTPDLAMTKVASAASYLVGDTARFTLRVQNVGTVATTDTVRVVDVLPAGLTFLSASPAGGFTCSLAAATVSCFRVAPLAVSALDSVRVNVLVGAAAAPSFVNRAVATTAGDLSHGNDTSATAAIPVSAVANLQLAKRVVGTLAVGGAGRFDLVARNVAIAGTTGATTIVDTLPGGIGYTSASGTGWSCAAAGQVVTCTRATTIPGNDSSTVSLTVSVGAAALPSIVNTAHASTPGELVTTDNAATTGAVPVTPTPDLSMTKLASAASYLVGDTARFTLRVQNVGTAATTDTVRVVDALPAGLTFLSASATGGFVCGVAGATVTCVRAAALAIGAVDSVRINTLVGVGAAPSFVNRGVATTAGDLSRGNDTSATAAIPVLASPNLQLAKRVVGTLAVGRPGRFDLVARNVVPVATTGPTTVVDTLPAGIGYTSASGTGWSCAATGQVVACTQSGAIAGSDSSTLTLNVSVAAAALPSVVNTARASTPGETVTTDNSGTTGAVPVSATPDLRMVKAAVGAFVVGSPATYTLSVTNVGTGTTTDTIYVRDSLPTRLTFVSAAGPGFGCSVAGVWVTCVRTSPLSAGASVIVTLVATPSELAVPSVTNVAFVQTTGDVSNANNISIVTTPVSGVKNIAIAKSGADTLAVGASATWTLTATNVGSLSVATFSIVDTLPAGVTFTSASGAGYACAAAGAVVTCTRSVPLAPVTSAPVTVTGLVTPAAFPAITNYVVASLAGDADTTDNRASHPSVVRGTVDLEVVKVATTAEFTAGIANSYLFKVANRGTVPTQGAITIVDTLPAGLAFTSGAGTGWTCSAVGPVVTCTTPGPIAQGDSSRVTLTVLAAGTLSGAVTNCATGATPLDATPANNRSCATTTVLGDFRLFIEKTSRSASVTVGGTNDYTILVKNVGRSPVPTVQVIDALPAGFTYQAGTSRLDNVPIANPATVANQLTWSLGTLAPGEEHRIAYRVRIGIGVREGTSINRARARSGTIIAQANNTAAPVIVRRGVFSDRGVVVGKIFTHCDCNDDRLQVRGELGIPGVRVVMEDGTAAITDVEGKYNFWDVPAGLHVVKVDASTLPAGATLVPTGNRNARDGGSRFVDLKGGELHKADFATANDADVLALVKARRRNGDPTAAVRGRVPSDSARLDFSNPAAVAAAAPASVSEQARVDQLEEAVPSQPTAFTPVTGMAPALSDATSNLPATPLKASTATMGTSNGRVELHVDALAYPADGISVIPVRVRLFDAKGNKLAGRVPVTLEASLGRWLVGDVERAAEGAQVTVTDGEATFMLAAPSQPGRGEVRVTSPLAQAAVPLLFTPSQRALMVAGLVHGRVEFGTFSGGAAVTSAPTDGFEDRLSNWAFASDSGRARGGVRAAVFAKGTVMGDRLLTLGFDSERNRQDPQFRDISPDEMYPTYGDASQREFDAQSTQRLYARLDHGATYTRLGDFATQRGGEGRVFSAWERSLTGVQHHGESARGTFNVYAAQGTITQVRDEIPGRGMSGPYFLSRANAVINSERVEIVTRDRNQPALILVTKAMTRFADYTIEPYSGRLLFRAPVPSLDANFNPVSIRIVYEVDQGGGEFYTYGADAQVKLGDRYEVGGVVAQDLNPLDSLRLVGANISARFGERTLAIAELAHSEGVGNIVGNAGRIEFRHQDGKFETRLFGARAGAGFGNRSSTFIAGRQELGGRASYALSADTRLLAEVIETQDTRTNGKRTGALLSIEHAFGTLLRAELGYRWAREDGAASALTATLPTPPRLSALRARVTLKLPGSDRTSIFAELEQDMQLSDARRGAIGGEWLLSTRARLYARHEWTNGYAGPYALTPQQSQQNTVVGIDADYMQNAQVFSEYRARDAFSGRDAEASIGLRNRWSLAPGLLVNTSAERVAPLAGAGQGTATALTGAIEWTRPATSKVTGRLEWRNAAKEGDGWLMSAGLAQKLTRDWTLLARTQWDKQGAIADRNRSHLGVAWRETDRNQWNGLLRYERRHERTTATGAPEVSSDVDIMAGLLNWQPTDRLVLSGRLAAKVGRENREGTASESQAQLLMGRATYDLTRSWDVGLISSLLVADGGSARRYGAGAEIGRLVATNLRLAVGYNLFGYREKDLDAFGYTSRGAYVEFAFKFDETLFGRGKTAAGSPK